MSIQARPRLLDQRERPRERLRRFGASNLRNDELLALVLRCGSAGTDVLTLAHQVLSRFPLTQLAHANIAQLSELRGIESAQACAVLAAVEFGQRSVRSTPSEYPFVGNATEALTFLYPLRRYTKEHCVALYLNARCQLLHYETVSVGTLDCSLLHPREVFEPAIRHLAAHVVLAHNHPSGSADPSVNDRTITDRIAAAGAVIGIELLDHLIVSSRGYFSFAEHGWLPGSDGYGMTEMWQSALPPPLSNPTVPPSASMRSAAVPSLDRS